MPAPDTALEWASPRVSCHSWCTSSHAAQVRGQASLTQLESRHTAQVAFSQAVCARSQETGQARPMPENWEQVSGRAMPWHMTESFSADLAP